MTIPFEPSASFLSFPHATTLPLLAARPGVLQFAAVHSFPDFQSLLLITFSLTSKSLLLEDGLEQSRTASVLIQISNLLLFLHLHTVLLLSRLTSHSLRQALLHISHYIKITIP